MFRPIFTFFILSLVALSTQAASPTKSIKRIIKEQFPGLLANGTPIFSDADIPPKAVRTYLEILNDQAKETCTKESLETYQNYYQKYKSAGFYIPTLRDQLDKDSTTSIVPMLKKRSIWIGDQLMRLKKAGLPQKKIQNQMTLIRATTKKILKLNKNFEFNDLPKAKYTAQLNQNIDELRTQWNQLINMLSFLTNFMYPIDHESNRFEYDRLRALPETLDILKKKNALYLKRKFLEDGTYEADGTNSDMIFRTALDTIELGLQNAKGAFEENLRYDMAWALNQIARFMGWGAAEWQERLKAWQQRTDDAIVFYESLLSSVGTQSTESLIRDRLRTSNELKNFVLNKQADVYGYWFQEDQIFQALFALEQILMHEVGAATVGNFLDRLDVSQVVFNRWKGKSESVFGANSRLAEAIRKNNDLTTEQIRKAKWLNVLFKDGEFSFTQFFLGASKYVFCPDMTSIAKHTREENLRLALDALKSARFDFTASRYFSRVSMVGKVDMAKSWKSFEAIPESPGFRVQNQSQLIGKYRKGDWDFLYKFVSEQDLEYVVMDIDGIKYTVSLASKKPVFFEYRDPNYFRFFRKKKSRQ